MKSGGLALGWGRLMRDGLISIRPAYVNRILLGKKRVEIRTRRLLLSPGARLWIYATLPRGCLSAVASVSSVEFDSPSAIWKRHNEAIDISSDAYQRYVNGANKVSAIVFGCVQEIQPSISLDVLRGEIQGFHPPQFLRYIESSNSFFALLLKNITGESE